MIATPRLVSLMCLILSQRRLLVSGMVTSVESRRIMNLPSHTDLMKSQGTMSPELKSQTV